MRRVFVFTLLLALAGATGPRADTDKGSATNPYLLSDSIVVTANRFGVTVEKLAWPTTSLNSDELDQEASLATTLDGLGGADIRESGGVGSLATMSSWGLFNRQLLLLYDGRVVKDYSLGGFNLSEYSLDEFERIEVVKGPQSSFYGADAIGGVVNLITRKSLVNRIEITSRYGTNNHRSARIDITRSIGKIGVGGFAEFTAADNARDNAGIEQVLFGIRADYLSADGRHLLGISARHFDDSLGAPGPQPDGNWVPVYGSEESMSLFDHQKDRNYSVDARYRYTDESLGELQIDLFWEKKNLDFNGLYNYQSQYYTYDTTGSEPDIVVDSILWIDSVDVRYLSIYNKRSAGISGRYMKEMSLSSFSTGFDILSGSVRATNHDTSDGTNIIGPFAPYEYHYGNYNYWSESQNQYDIWGAAAWQPEQAVRFDLSGRLHFIKDRRVQPSGNVGAIYSPLDDLRFKLAYGYAFRLPTIAEQFADNVFAAGNADLKSETSHSLVGTISYSLPTWEFNGRLAVFHQQVDSLIQYDWSVFPAVPCNIDRFRSTGLDLSFALAPLQSLGLKIGLVYQDAEQTTDETGEFMRSNFVPKLKGRLDSRVKLSSHLAIGMSLVYTGERHYRSSLGYVKAITDVVELGASVTTMLSRQLKIVLSGQDLTDQARPDQFGGSPTDHNYPTPGRRFYLKVVATIM